jgi:hypothetical protein
VFTKNRERLIGGDIAGKFMAAVLNKGSVKAGSHHDRQVGEPLLDLAEQLLPVHAGHVDVGEDRHQRGFYLTREPKRCSALRSEIKRASGRV